MSNHECQSCGRKKSEFPDLNFYRFPKHRDKCMQWIELSGLTHLYKLPVEVLHMKRLCAEHFKPNQFCRDKPSILKPRATPTIFFHQQVAENHEAVEHLSTPKPTGPKLLLPKYNFAEARKVSTVKTDGKWMNMPKITADTFLQMLPNTQQPMSQTMLFEQLQSQVDTAKKARQPKLRRLADLCRVCGKLSVVKMTKIFSPEGRELALEEKILRFLPIAVKSSEINMPLRVCTPCINKLDACYDLWEMCSKADIVMRSRLEQGILTEVVESEAEREARENEEQQKQLDQQVANVMRTWGAQQLAQSIVVAPSSEDTEAAVNQFVMVSVESEPLPTTSRSLLNTSQKPMLLPQPKTFIISPATQSQSSPQSILKSQPSLLKRAMATPVPTKPASKLYSLLKKNTETPAVNIQKSSKSLSILKKPAPAPKPQRTLLHVPKGVSLYSEPEILRAPISTGKKSRKSNLSEEVKKTNRDQRMFKLNLGPKIPQAEVSSDEEPIAPKKSRLEDSKPQESLLKPNRKLIQMCGLCDVEVPKLVQHYSEIHCKFLCPICTDCQLYFDTEESLKEHFNEAHSNTVIKKSLSFESLNEFDDIQHFSFDESNGGEEDSGDIDIKILEVHSEAD